MRRPPDPPEMRRAASAKGSPNRKDSNSSTNIATDPVEIQARRFPVISGIRRGPGGKADWLVSIERVCTETPFRDRKLRNYRRFCNAIKYRFGVTFDSMPQADWLVIVEAAIAEAGASRACARRRG
jgi:hypothetical protein